MTEEQEPQPTEIDPLINLIIPECCKEGWDSCIHTVKREKPKKRNIGL